MSDVADVAPVALPGEGEGGWDEFAPNEWEALTGHLEDLRALLVRHIVFPSSEAADVAAAWIVHAHLVRCDAFESTPRLAVLSPEKGSGKTRVLEVFELVVPEPLHTVNVSPAALFRLVEAKAPTLLMDECDTTLGPHVRKENEEVRGLVNAGHRRGASAHRCVGEAAKMTVKEFPAFCAVVLAGIGDLPETITSRSVIFQMKKRRPDEPVTPFRAREVRPIGQAIRDRLAKWTAANAKAIDEMRVDMPEGITDRPADVWEPLVVIGDAAGPEWSARIRRACVALSAVTIEQEASLGVRLLGDIRRVLGDADRIHTEQLLERLNALDDAPWGDLRGKPLDARGLARRLKQYGVRPADVRIGEKVAKGYDRPAFHDAWSRYLTLPAESATWATNNPSVADVAQSAEEQPPAFAFDDGPEA
jgi:hypothetical protein